jgi:Ca2+-binding EF-hand superfamily protein
MKIRRRRRVAGGGEVGFGERFDLIYIFITDEGNEKEREQSEGLQVHQPQQQALGRHGTPPSIQENEIKDAFSFYDSTNSGYITRQNLRSILGNFAYTKMNGKEIEDEITNVHQDKESFSLSEVVDLITKKWFFGRGREEEALDMFALFDRKEKGLVGINEIKAVFNQYLDINISDNDILEFI